MVRIGRRCRNAAGELLRERRQQLRLDLDAVAEALCIKPVYLAAIEQGRTEELPGPTYAIGFIRAYANYLGLDGESVLDRYREEDGGRSDPPGSDPSGAARRAQRSRRPGAADRPGPGAVRLRHLVLCRTGERERPERVAAVPAELQHLTAPPPSVRGSDQAAPIETLQPTLQSRRSTRSGHGDGQLRCAAAPQARLAAAGRKPARRLRRRNSARAC